MFKSKTKYRWEGWESSGNEPWVFNVEHPRDLMGVHAKLIDKELKTDEKVEYCIYAPRISSTSTPTGLKSEESSCGFCVTDHRLIITKNRHIKSVDPVLISVDFMDILYFNIGSVSLLSWFSISYACNGLLKHLPVIFASNGRQHFTKALRSVKKYCLPISTDMETFSAGSFIHRIKDSVHRDYLRTIMSLNERCILTFPCRYLWRQAKESGSLFSKEKYTYVASSGSALLTNKALLIARSGIGFSVGNCTDIVNLPLDRIKSFSVYEGREGDRIIYELKISFLKDTQSALNISLLSFDDKEKMFLNKIQSLFNDTKQKEGKDG